MRLLQITGLCCLLLSLALPVTTYAVQPTSQVYGPVTTKETLSEIAQKVRGEWRIPLKYVVQAMYEINPQAFSETGINSLHIGSLLIIPDMQALSNEVPELLANTPKPTQTPPTTTRTRATPDNRQTQQLQQQINEQLSQFDLLLTNNQHNIDALKKLISQVNTFQQRSNKLQAQLDSLLQQQKTDARRVQALQTRIESLAATGNVPTEGNPAPIKTNSQDLFLILLLIPTLLAIIAIVLARRSPARNIPLPEPTFRAPEIFMPVAQPSADTQVDDEVFTDEESATDDTPSAEEITDDKSVVAELSADEPEPASEDMTIADLLDDSFRTDALTNDDTVEPDNDEPPTPEETTIEAIDKEDISEELLTIDESSVAPKLEEENTEQASSTVTDIQNLTTEKDDIEARLSLANLHVDMGNVKQGKETLNEIDLVAHPEFIKQVDEIWDLIAKSDVPPKPTAALNAVSRTAKTAEFSQTDAMDRVMAEQLKLAHTYFSQGELSDCKIYIAKILRNGTAEYRDKALALLKEVEFEEASPHAKSSATQAPDTQTHDDEKTVLVQPQASPENTAQPEQTDNIKKADYHDIIPHDISNRFEAYTDNEEGTKLALAYLFLDLDEVDTAKQLLEEVLEEGDEAMTAEAELVLKKLQA